MPAALPSSRVQLSLGAALLLSACEAGTLHGLVATANEDTPTTLNVAWDLLSPAGETWVEYGPEPDSLPLRTPSGRNPHAIVLGLTAGRTWHLRAVTVEESGQRWESEVLPVEVAPPPDELPYFAVTDVDEAAIDPDSIVMAALLQPAGSWLVGLNRGGEYVWWLRMAGRTAVPSLHLSRDGEALVFLEQAKVGDTSQNGVRIARLDGSNNSLTIAPEGHHDALQLPDGRIAWLSAETVDGVKLQDGSLADLSVDLVRETEADATSASAAQTAFSFLDDYPPTPWRTCQHFEEVGPGGGLDYSHANSLMYDAEHDAYLVMAKNLDALVSIDRSTAAVNWQAGGRYGTLLDVAGDTIPGDDTAWNVDGPNKTWWSHGHMSHAWNGGFLVFDNGYHHDPSVSRAVEYAIDPEAGTLEKVWSFSSESGALNPVLGDVRKLPDTYLISWTLQGMITEVTPEGEVVWRASSELGTSTGRLLVLPSLYPS